MEETFAKTDMGTIMTVHDVAQYLRLSQAKVYRLAQAGAIPAMRIGKSWRFRKDLIDEWFRRSVHESLESSDD